jgi:class 3 adenylate cyclase
MTAFQSRKLTQGASVHLGHENTKHPSWTKRAGGAQVLDALNTHLVESAEPMFPRESAIYSDFQGYSYFLAEVRRAMCWTDEQESGWKEVEEGVLQDALAAADTAMDAEDAGEVVDDDDAEDGEGGAGVDRETELSQDIHFNESHSHSNAGSPHSNASRAHSNEAPTDVGASASTFTALKSHSNASRAHSNEVPTDVGASASTFTASKGTQEMAGRMGGKSKASNERSAKSTSYKKSARSTADDTSSAATDQFADGEEVDEGDLPVGPHPGSAYVAPSTNMTKEEMRSELLAEVELEKWRGHFRGRHDADDHRVKGPMLPAFQLLGSYDVGNAKGLCAPFKHALESLLVIYDVHDDYVSDVSTYQAIGLAYLIVGPVSLSRHTSGVSTS